MTTANLNNNTSADNAPESLTFQQTQAMLNSPELKAAAAEAGANMESSMKKLLGGLKTRGAKSGLANKNIIGGLVGIGAAVGLELLSPTGSKKSAVVAGLCSGAVLYSAKNALEIAPECAEIAVGTGVMTFYVGMVAGRITADYFPGNIDIEE